MRFLISDANTPIGRCVLLGKTGGFDPSYLEHRSFQLQHALNNETKHAHVRSYVIRRFRTNDRDHDAPTCTQRSHLVRAFRRAK